MRFVAARTRPALGLAFMLLVGGIATVAEAKRPAPPPPQPPACAFPQPRYVLFLDDYPTGQFELAALPCLYDAAPGTVSPRGVALDLPRRDRQGFQVGNGDVYFDGSTRWIVFGGRTGANEYWGIYRGVLDVSRGLITNITALVNTPFVREEDPRFSTDGRWIVYKRDGEIWRVDALSPNAVPSLFHRETGCELWAPSMYANVVSYVRRCNDDPSSDRIVYHLEGNAPVIVPSYGGGPDRFAHFTQYGDLVYSHVDAADDTASLWTYIPGAYPVLLHQQTTSDDDPYAERNGYEYVAFSGWGNDRYDLYVYRRTLQSAVRLTSGINVLGSVLFD
jgi:hypothetical protein